MKALFIVLAILILDIAIAEPIASSVMAIGLFGFPDVFTTLSPLQVLTAFLTYVWTFPRDVTVQAWAGPSLAAGMGVAFVIDLLLIYSFLSGRRRLRVARIGEVPPTPQRAASKTHDNADWLSMERAHEIFPGEHPEWGGIAVGEAYRPDLDRSRKGSFNEAVPASWGQGGKAPLLIDPVNGTSASSGIIIAGSGSFKSVAFIVPAMITWRGPCVVLEPSLRVAPLVTRHRQELGQTVIRINPKIGSGGFNVLASIDLDSPLAELDIIEFIDWTMPEATSGQDTPGDGNNFFRDAGKELATCILCDMLWDTDLPRSARTVKEWRRRLVIPEKELRRDLQKVYATSKSSIARDLAGSIMGTYVETFSSVYKHVSTSTRWLSIAALADLLSGDTFKATDLLQGELTVFLEIPDNVHATPGFARAVIGSLARTVLQANGCVVTPIPFFMDEIDMLGEAMPILAVLRDQGRRCKAPSFPVFQSIGQITKTWGEDGRKAWYASAAWRMYASVNDEATAEEVRKRCGGYTILDRSEGTSSNSSYSGIGQNNRSRGINGNVSLKHRDLATAYEIQTTFRPDEAILIPRNEAALRCGRPLWWRRPEWAALLKQPERLAS